MINFNNRCINIFFTDADSWNLVCNYEILIFSRYILNIDKICININLLQKHYAYYIVIGGDNTLNESSDRIYREDTERIRFGSSSDQSLQRCEHKNMIFTISKIYNKCNIISYQIGKHELRGD